MSISFNQIPANFRVPFLRFEVNPGQAPYQSIQRLLLIGQVGSNATAILNEPVIVTGGEDALLGVGSMATGMYKLARGAAAFQEIWALPLADALDASPALGSVSIEGAPLAEPDTIVLYVGGCRVSVPVTTTMTNAEIADALIDAINGFEGMQVAASIGHIGTKATGTSTLTGTATSVGVMTVTANGIAVSVDVTTGGAVTAIAAAMATAINESSSIGLTAVATAGALAFTAKDSGIGPNTWPVTVTSTAVGITASAVTMVGGTQEVVATTHNNAGTCGNTLRIETQIFFDDPALANTMCGITQPANGAGDPSTMDIMTALANLGEEQYDWIVMPYCFGAYVEMMDAFLANRWGPDSQVYGHCLTAFDGTAGQVLAFTTQQNSFHVSVLPTLHSPQPTYLNAAVLGALCAVHLQAPPELSRPLKTLSMTGLIPPKAKSDRWDTPTRNSFYFAGASGYVVGPAGDMQLDRVITLYQQNASGQPDMTWLDINTIAQVTYGIRSIMADVTQAYPRSALVDTNPGNLQGFVTVTAWKNEMIHAYTVLVNIGVFDDADTFAQLLICERNANDPNRIDTYLPVKAVNQLQIGAVALAAYLQYPTSA